MDSGDIWARMFQRARGEEVLTTHKPASVPSHTADKALACWLENPCPNENSARKFHSYLELARKVIVLELWGSSANCVSSLRHPEHRVNRTPLRSLWVRGLQKL